MVYPKSRECPQAPCMGLILPHPKPLWASPFALAYLLGRLTTRQWRLRLPPAPAPAPAPAAATAIRAAWTRGTRGSPGRRGRPRGGRGTSRPMRSPLGSLSGGLWPSLSGGGGGRGGTLDSRRLGGRGGQWTALAASVRGAGLRSGGARSPGLGAAPPRALPPPPPLPPRTARPARARGRGPGRGHGRRLGFPGTGAAPAPPPPEGVGEAQVAGVPGPRRPLRRQSPRTGRARRRSSGKAGAPRLPLTKGRS